jgi:RNA polymerase sigma-70 factor (ECF subfamily)
MNSPDEIESLTDIAIVYKVQEGEVNLFELLIRRYSSYLYKIGRACGYNHSDTEDLMQETYIIAYRHLSAFKNHSSFKIWIVKIMLNSCNHKKLKFNCQKELRKIYSHQDF